jgi:hypothetical protein
VPLSDTQMQALLIGLPWQQLGGDQAIAVL